MIITFEVIVIIEVIVVLVWLEVDFIVVLEGEVIAAVEVEEKRQ